VQFEQIGLAASLAGLGVLLAIVAGRAYLQYVRKGQRTQLAWGTGLLFGSLAMFVETSVYLGHVDNLILQAYVFFSAAIVGTLSLGATKVLKRPRFEQAYTAFILAASALVAVFSFATSMPSSMVSGGVIAGDPPLLLLLLSSLVTGPATVVLITSAILGLRRSWRWQTLLMVAGALVLGAGGTFYIASFPIVLYYAEFLGIGLLFLGLISLPTVAPAAAPGAVAAGAH
jgi:hypothetical protein